MSYIPAPWIISLLTKHLITEVSRQTVVPFRVARLRLYYYYHINHIDFVWLSIYRALHIAIDTGKLIEYHLNKKWYHLPGADSSTLNSLYSRRKPIYDHWMNVAYRSGKWFEDIVRDAFRQKHYVVADKPVTFSWQSNKDTTSIEVDVFTSSPHKIGISLKNKLSEMYIAPDIIDKYHRSEDHLKIDNLFQSSSSLDFTPVLFAPLIDNSFYGYQAKYKGLFCRYLFQYVPIQHKDLCDAIRQDFRFSQVRAIDSPPSYILNWVSGIPSFLSKYS